MDFVMAGYTNYWQILRLVKAVQSKCSRLHTEHYENMQKCSVFLKNYFILNTKKKKSQ